MLNFKGVKVFVLFLALFFMFVIPKAGTKLSGIPIYPSLFFSFAFVFYCFYKSLKLNNLEFLCLSAFLFFVVFFQVFYFSRGGVSLGFFSYLIPMLTPVLIVLFKGVDVNKILFYLGWAFWIVTLYGLSQKVFGDYNVVIPGVTANYFEAQEHDFLAKKHNMLWGLGYLKLTSTYQNGNIFGVNYLLISWMYVAYRKCCAKSNFYILGLTFIVCCLTASASVVIGFLGGFVFYILYSFRLKDILKLIFLSFIVFLIVASFSSYGGLFFDIVNSRFIDRDYSQAGGRMSQVISFFTYLNDNPATLFFGSLLDSTKTEAVYEMWIISIVQNFGLVAGLGFFIIYFFSIYKIKISYFKVPFIAYFFAALSDGAFWSPPTSFNLFVLLSLAISFSAYLKYAKNFSLGRSFEKNIL